jgi:hypothetical protein
MYQSTGELLKSLEKESLSNKIISDDVGKMIRSTLLQQGLSPIITEEPNPNAIRDIVFEYLKTVTYQPKKVMDYLYNNNQMEEFSKYINEFNKEHIKGRKNLTGQTIITEWEYYKSQEVPKLLGKEIMNRLRYDEERARAGIATEEDLTRSVIYAGMKEQEIQRKNFREEEIRQRAKVIKAEYDARRYQIRKRLEELQKEVINATKNMIENIGTEKEKIYQDYLDELAKKKVELNKELKEIKIDEIKDLMTDEELMKYEEEHPTGHGISRKEKGIVKRTTKKESKGRLEKESKGRLEKNIQPKRRLTEYELSRLYKFDYK